MPDLTTLYYEILDPSISTKKDDSNLKQKQTVAKSNTQNTVEPYLSEANQILNQIENLNTYLINTRISYLNLHSLVGNNNFVKVLNEREKDEIDTQTKLIINGCFERIEKLATVAGWDADFDSLLSETRKNIVFQDGLDTEEESEDDLNLTQQEKLMFESENEQIFSELQSTLDVVRVTTQSIQEISNLQNQLVKLLQLQSEKIELIYEDSYKSVGQIEDGNKRLLNAEKNFGQAKKWLLFFLIFSTLIILFLDWFN
ncbi:hypothetical protein HK099_000172 [Clydaea vesicula]|uniref:t-SNARE coiled-coil homology domain-containing protein n=1 Tax=Clydaea vesicula TaxID=447962 RepID=A0AAD5TVD8_9FUNG|nr:hypothetical protein HK099_000172 [Clydaea vesicula]